MSLTDLIAHAAAWNVGGSRITAVVGPPFDTAGFARWHARPAERAT